MEKRLLIQQQRSIPYEKSLVATVLANQFLRSLAPVLDWSSIAVPSSFVYNSIIRDSPSVSAMVDFLVVKTKNQPFRLKCESGGRPLHTLVAPSAKQHILTCYPTNSLFPVPISNKSDLICKKLKGIQRSQHSNITLRDFINVAIKGQPARRVPTARLQRSSYCIYLTRGSKSCLSRLSSKRLFDSRFKTQQSFFSFPLNWLNKLS